MSNAITKIAKKEDLTTLLNNNTNAVARIDENKREDFKKNFIELWNNKYLIGQADASELLEFCIQITNIGLSVNPWHKEVYILPFAIYEGKAPNKRKVGVRLEAVFTKNGIQEMAFNNGFQMEVDTVWKIGGEGVELSSLDFDKRADVDFTNQEYVSKNFLGFNFKLFDLNNKLREQNYFVTMAYLEKVTKKLESKDHQIANYSHKAFRKAYSEFFIPKGRDTRDIISRLDNLNNEEIETVETTPSKINTKSLNDVLNKENKTEIVEEKVVTIQDINNYYKQNLNKKDLMQKVLQGTGWRDFNSLKLGELMGELKKL